MERATVSRWAKRSLVLGVAAGAIFTGGYFAGRSDGPAEPVRAANLWADGCIYKTQIDSDSTGTFTRLTALVWDVGYGGGTSSVTDYAARHAVGDFDCERVY